MNRFFVSIVGVLLLLSMPLAQAHEEHSHQRVMGTVSKVDQDHLVVKAKDGKTVSIRLTNDTEYQGNGGETDRSALKVGDRVVVTAMGEENDLTAHEVRFSEEAACPIDGMKLKVADDTPSTEYHGKTYYFCSEDEKRTFLTQPDRYVAH